MYDIEGGDHIAVIEMDESLLDPAVGILDHASGTLSPLKNGGRYTLMPIDDHRLATLNRVKDVYTNITTTPAKLFSTSVSRMDDLLMAVGLLFSEVTYTVVENKEDMQNILKPPKDYEPKKVTYNVVSDLLKAVGVEYEPQPHKCDSNCSH